MALSFKQHSFAFQLVLAQFIVALLLAGVSLLISQRPEVSLSLLVGGLTCCLANLWFAVVAFRPKLRATPGKMLSAFYVGEMGRFVVIALAFMVAFQRLEWLKEVDNVVALFAGYMVNQGVVWVFPLLKK